MTCIMQAGAWPGVWIASHPGVPTLQVSPSSNSRSRCGPSGWNSAPSLKTLPNLSSTKVMLHPMPILPPGCFWLQGEADR